MQITFIKINKISFLFLKVGSIRLLINPLPLGWGSGDSLPLSPAMNSSIFQTEIVKYSFKIIKMILIRTLNLNLILILNCQPIWSLLRKAS